MLDQEAIQAAENKDHQDAASDGDTIGIEALSLEDLIHEQIEAHKILTDSLESQKSEVSDALSRHAKEQGELLVSHRDAILSNEKRYAKESLTDEQQENVSVWIRQMPEEVNSAGDVEQEEMIQRFQSYNSHHYIDEKWDILGEQTGKDEEWWIPDPQVFPEDHPSYLCGMCRHISFEALFTQRGLPGNVLPGPTKISLYGFEKMIRRYGCSFCRMITKKAWVDKVIDLYDEDEVKAVDIQLNVIDEGEEHAIRLEVELMHERIRWPTQRYVIQRFVLEQPKLFNAFPVKQDKACSTVLRNWLLECECRHPKQQSVVQKAQRLRLIDVQKCCVCEMDLPCRYVCLSYVWGGVNQVQNVESTRDTIQQPGGLSRGSINLPKTITDAMEVARWLDIQYIWVDALCIEQDNSLDMEHNISNMLSIYNGATLNIVASSNLSPLEGLPGVTTVRRSSRQICAKIQDIEVAVALNDARMPVAEIELSKWNTRGWTYQERQLSHRSVFFTESQMIFMCSQKTCYEDSITSEVHDYRSSPIDNYAGGFASPHVIYHAIRQDPTQHLHINKSFMTDDGIFTMISQEIDISKGFPEVKAPVYEHKVVKKSDHNGILLARGMNFWNLYRQAVASYTQRNLTNTKDIMPAFRGLSDLIKGDANIPFWYNLPSSCFDWSLLWYSEQPLTRRRHNDLDLHPSWTWAGWEGIVKYRGRGWYNGLYRGPVSAVMWQQNLKPEAFLERCPQIIRQKPGFAEWIARKLAKDLPTLCLVSPELLYHFSNYKKAGWVNTLYKTRNQHAYLHPNYPYQPFDHPIPLAGQETTILPDASGTIYFRAYTSDVQFTDTRVPHHTSSLGAEQFLQIGLHDEARSCNQRPPHRRILYHQGYRAGILNLNIPFTDLTLDHPDRYSLIAMSRDELPRIAPPEQGEEAYRELSPVDLHYHIGYKEYYELKPEEFFQQIVPAVNEDDAEPETGPWCENGDPQWDAYRFGDYGAGYPLYNVLLVEKVRDADGAGNAVRRVGVGKMFMGALHHAGAEMRNIALK